MKAAIHSPIAKLMSLLGRSLLSRRGLPPGPIPDAMLPIDLVCTHPLAASLLPEENRSASA